MKRNKWLFALVLVGIGLLAAHRAHRGVVILHYHAVNDFSGKEKLVSVRPADFAWQLDYLERAGYSVVSVAEAVNYLQTGEKLPPKAVAITFDDGYQDNYEHALPLLKEHGFPASIFVVTGEIQGSNSWDTPKGFKELSLLSWRELEELSQNNVSIMPHSVNHLNLTKLDPEAVEQELVESKAVLESRLGGSRPYFAYPYGSLNQDVVNATKAAGYSAAFTSSPGTNVYKKTDLYRIRRMPIKETHRGFWGRLLFILELKLNSLHPAQS